MYDMMDVGKRSSLGRGDRARYDGSLSLCLIVSIFAHVLGTCGKVSAQMDRLVVRVSRVI